MRDGSVVYESARKTRDGRHRPRGGQLEPHGRSTVKPLVLSISRDISDRKKIEQELERLSLPDELTGLFNRRGFYVMIPERRKHARRTRQSIRSCSTPTSTASRTQRHARSRAWRRRARRRGGRASSGLPRNGPHRAVWAATSSASSPRRTLRPIRPCSARVSTRPSSTAGVEVGERLSLSYGAVVTDWRGLEDPDELLTRADMLMYEAKRARRAHQRDEPPEEMAGRGVTAACPGSACVDRSQPARIRFGKAGRLSEMSERRGGRQDRVRGMDAGPAARGAGRRRRHRRRHRARARGAGPAGARRDAPRRRRRGLRHAASGLCSRTSPRT